MKPSFATRTTLPSKTNTADTFPATKKRLGDFLQGLWKQTLCVHLPNLDLFRKQTSFTSLVVIFSVGGLSWLLKEPGGYGLDLQNKQTFVGFVSKLTDSETPNGVQSRRNETFCLQLSPVLNSTELTNSNPD